MIQGSRATWRLLLLLISLGSFVLICACVKLPRQSMPSTAINDGQSAGAPLIDINTASPDELEKLPGIGRGLAARIIEHRERYGRFRRVEHLIMMRGIGERRFRKMRSLIQAL
jgi:competence protein ComEA